VNNLALVVTLPWVQQAHQDQPQRPKRVHGGAPIPGTGHGAFSVLLYYCRSAVLPTHRAAPANVSQNSCHTHTIPRLHPDRADASPTHRLRTAPIHHPPPQTWPRGETPAGVRVGSRPRQRAAQHTPCAHACAHALGPRPSSQVTRSALGLCPRAPTLGAHTPRTAGAPLISRRPRQPARRHTRGARTGVRPQPPASLPRRPRRRPPPPPPRRRTRRRRRWAARPPGTRGSAS
jgi:hypothetical protein